MKNKMNARQLDIETVKKDFNNYIEKASDKTINSLIDQFWITNMSNGNKKTKSNPLTLLIEAIEKTTYKVEQ